MAISCRENWREQHSNKRKENSMLSLAARRVACMARAGLWTKSPVRAVVTSLRTRHFCRAVGTVYQENVNENDTYDDEDMRVAENGEGFDLESAETAADEIVGILPPDVVRKIVRCPASSCLVSEDVR